MNPITNEPIIFTPKRWLKFVPWISYDDYFTNCFSKEKGPNEPRERVVVVNYNRKNFDLVSKYLEIKERGKESCSNDPLFNQIPLTSAKRKLKTIRALPSGKTDNADKKYEDCIVQLFASLLYPDLDFASEQSRTDSGSHIRDIIFYNSKSDPFLAQIWDEYDSKQIVFEMKNVNEIERDHLNQMNRYLGGPLGNFGVIVTRNPLSKAMMTNTISLWSSQRKCIIVLTDEDVALMTTIFGSKQRKPLDVLTKKYTEFTRALPS